MQQHVLPQALAQSFTSPADHLRVMQQLSEPTPALREHQQLLLLGFKHRLLQQRKQAVQQAQEAQQQCELTQHGSRTAQFRLLLGEAQDKWERARAEDRAAWEQQRAQRQQEWALQQAQAAQEWLQQQQQEQQRWESHRVLQEQMWQRGKDRQRQEWQQRPAKRQRQEDCDEEAESQPSELLRGGSSEAVQSLVTTGMASPLLDRPLSVPEVRRPNDFNRQMPGCRPALAALPGLHQCLALPVHCLSGVYCLYCSDRVPPARAAALAAPARLQCQRRAALRTRPRCLRLLACSARSIHAPRPFTLAVTACPD